MSSPVETLAFTCYYTFFFLSQLTIPSFSSRGHMRHLMDKVSRDRVIVCRVWVLVSVLRLRLETYLQCGPDLDSWVIEPLIRAHDDAVNFLRILAFRNDSGLERLSQVCVGSRFLTGLRGPGCALI